MRLADRRSGAGLVLAVALLGSGLGGPGVLGVVPQHAINVAPAAGAPGQSVTLTGEGLGPGLVYEVLVCPTGDVGATPCGYSGANLIGLGEFTADADGHIPAGTTGVIPNLLAGDYAIEVFSGSAVVGSGPFSVTAPTLTVSPGGGPSGLSVAVGGSAYAPGATYVICLVPEAEVACGGVGIPLADFTADGTGAVPPGTHVSIPGGAPSMVRLGTFLKAGNATLIATAPFSIVAPTLHLESSEGPAGSPVRGMGAGYAPGVAYLLCLVPEGLTQCGGAGAYVGSFTADGAGGIPEAVLATMPTVSPGVYSVGVLLPDNTPVMLVTTTFRIVPGTLPTAPSSTVVPSATPGAPLGTIGGWSVVWWILLVLLAALIVLLIIWRSRRAATRKR